MTNDKIVDVLKLIAQLLELHDANPFKIRSLLNACFKIDKLTIDIVGVPQAELSLMDGIGKSLASKIVEIVESGTTSELQQLSANTPLGVIEMLGLKGIGPKKVQALWRELNVESLGELMYACNENRLVELKGFGLKTQDQIRKSIEFKMASAGKVHYASAEKCALDLIDFIRQKYAPKYISFVGALRRKCEVIEKIEILVSAAAIHTEEFLNTSNVPIQIYSTTEADFCLRLFQLTGSEAHVQYIQLSDGQKFESEIEIYNSKGYQFIPPELREDVRVFDTARNQAIPELIEMENLKGVLHNHSTYSDGNNTLREMALAANASGYEYLGICDHSQSAFYAGGLKAEKIIAQHEEIDALNSELFPFKIFKGIESDILNDGSLDYPEEILKSFDFIVASVHSNLKMDKEKATSRLIKAIENPYTTILGHPTGRLLLSRAAYPIDHEMVIDACADNGVIMELNAHPYRLDIDWRWIEYCLKKNVKISINPDAHSVDGYKDMYYGVCVARKGMLSPNMCFNTMTVVEMQDYFLSRKA